MSAPRAGPGGKRSATAIPRKSPGAITFTSFGAVRLRLEGSLMAFEFPASVVPGEYAITPDAAKGSHDEKFPPLGALYPERDRYLTVDPERYWSAAHMQREWDAVWTRAWTCAGRSSDLKGVGSWFKYDLGRESVIVVR